MSLESPALFYLDGPWSGDQAHAKIGTFCGQENLYNKKALRFVESKCFNFVGSAKGNRTLDFALRGRRLSRLTIAPFGSGTRTRTQTE